MKNNNFESWLCYGSALAAYRDNGKPMPWEIDDDICIMSDDLEDIEKILGENQATLFEVLTCAYLKHCEQFKQNISIIESGLMHHYDSTNVFNKNLASIIGSIGLDHL